MGDQLTAKDWLDQGLKTLAKSGFTALKAEPLAKTMGVSRGSFYWHFADIGAFHAAILKHWREVAAEAIIPLNGEGGRTIGVRTHLFLFLDDLIPAVFGKPLLGR